MSNVTNRSRIFLFCKNSQLQNMLSYVFSLLFCSFLEGEVEKWRYFARRSFAWINRKSLFHVSGEQCNFPTFACPKNDRNMMILSFSSHFFIIIFAGWTFDAVMGWGLQNLRIISVEGIFSLFYAVKNPRKKRKNIATCLSRL